MGELRTYDLANTIIVVTSAALGAARLGPGWADGDAVAIEWTSPLFNKQGGSQGEWSRSATNDRSATIRVMLMQTGASNDILDAYRLISERIGVGDIFTFSLTDLGGRTLVVAERCYVEARPPLNFGRDAGPREWTLFSADVDAKIGGNL